MLTEGQGPLFLARLQHRLQGSDRRHPAPDIDVILVAPKGSGTTVRRLLPRRQGHQLQLTPSTRTPPAAPSTAAWPPASPSAPATCSRPPFRKEVFSDLTGERGVLMGAIYGLWLAQYEVLREHGHSPSEAFNETVEEATQSALSADRRERHGLDVRQLLDDGPARRPRLVRPSATLSPRSSRSCTTASLPEKRPAWCSDQLARRLPRAAGQRAEGHARSEMWQAGAAVRSLRPENWKK